MPLEDHQKRVKRDVELKIPDNSNAFHSDASTGDLRVLLIIPEVFRTIPKCSEAFRSILNGSKEKSENRTPPV